VERYRRIAQLALPIVGAMVSQNVLNLVDTAMVGSLGDAAIAAVSTSSFVSWVSIAFVTGLSGAVQAMAARRCGEGQLREATDPLNAGLAMAVGVGLPLTVMLWVAAPHLYPFVNDDPEVVALAVPYLRVRALGMVAVGVNFAFRGYWNGIDRPRLYLWTLLVMHSFNIVLSYCLIFGLLGLPALGTQGAAIGTTTAAWLGVGTYVAMGLRHAALTGFPGRPPTAESLSTLLRLALPSSVQQLLFAGSFLVLFTIIGQLGTTEVAAAGVLVNVTLVAILPGMALGMAATTLVGQALGRGDTADAMRWGWDVVRVGVVGLGLLGLPMLLFPELCLTPFLWGRPDTIAVAARPLQLVGALMAVDAVGMVLQQALAGAGATRAVAGTSILLQWAVFLPGAWLAGPVAGGGLVGIWAVQAAQRVLAAIVYGTLWQRGIWKGIRV
jgi:MATE family multidrug resistance protein